VFAIGEKIFGKGEFIEKVDKDMQSTFRVVIYRDLGVLDSVKTVYLKLYIAMKLAFEVISDYQNMLRRFDSTSRVITKSTNAHSTIREILATKKELFRSLSSVKVVAY